MLTELEAKVLVEKNIDAVSLYTPIQDILDSGDIPRLKGYVAKKGKVSYSVFGGRFEQDGQAHENPPLEADGGIPIRMLFRSPQISTHDISRGEIPFKDQVVAVNHRAMRDLVRPYLGCSEFDVPNLPDSSLVIPAENLSSFGLENVLRRYMAKSTTPTSLYVAYQQGSRYFCGHTIPEGLKANGRLPYLMDTPSTKGKNDLSVSPTWLVEHGIVKDWEYNEIRNRSLEAFIYAESWLLERGIILADTKFEHGKNKRGEIVVQDEILTMDSSRFWTADDYKQALEGGTDPVSFSKQFARDKARGSEGFSKEDQIGIAIRYILGLQHLTGRPFTPSTRIRDDGLIEDTRSIVAYLGVKPV